MSDKEPGEIAHQAYYGGLINYRPFTETTRQERELWARVERACMDAAYDRAAAIADGWGYFEPAANLAGPNIAAAIRALTEKKDG